VSRPAWRWPLLACLTLGLAPYAPPHLIEKLAWLARGQTLRPIDVFDLVLHGAPWAWLGVTLVRRRRAVTPGG
jgi:hypothetical protein